MTIEQSIIIRNTGEADAAAMGLFGAMLMDLHHRWDRDRFIPVGSETSEAYGRWLRNQIVKNEVVALVAETADHMIGYILAEMKGYDYMSLRGPAGVIHDLFVEPASRKVGIGRRLLEEAVTQLAVLGAKQIVLSIAFKNEAAKRLFSSAGFRPTMLEMTRDIEV